MSQDNVNVVSSLYEAFAIGNIPDIMAALDPQVEWWEAENFIYADQNPYVGPDAVLVGVFMRIGNEWEEFSVSPKEVLDAGDTAIGHRYYTGTYKKNGERIHAQFAHFFTLREGKVVKFQQYTDTAQFLKAISAEETASSIGSQSSASR